VEFVGPPHFWLRSHDWWLPPLDSLLSLGVDLVTSERGFSASFSDPAAGKSVLRRGRERDRDLAVAACSSGGEPSGRQLHFHGAQEPNTATDLGERASVTLVINPKGETMASPNEGTKLSRCVANAFVRYPPKMKGAPGDSFVMDARYRPVIRDIRKKPVSSLIVTRLFTLESDSYRNNRFENISSATSGKSAFSLDFPGRVVFTYSHSTPRHKATQVVTWPVSEWNMMPQREASYP
jgi:hypothetical protein